MFNIRDNLMDLQGTSTDNNLTHILVKPSLNRIVQISEMYGVELGYSDNIKVYKDYIDITNGIQQYDIN